jgi:D-lactate dehydrogenase (cytochrome)
VAVESVVAALRETSGDGRVSTNEAVRGEHGRGEGFVAAQPPDAVFFARSTAEVAEAVRLCAAARVPVIAFGAGTSLEGHVGAVDGGLCIDLAGLNRIVGVNVDDLDCTVEAGVTRLQLNDHLKATGLFFPIDPGADATLGGMAATRASGTNAVRYGTMRDNVLAVTAVLADGRVIRTTGRARKSSAGYDLTALLVGSEGTLGIITEVTLRLYPVPEAMSSAIVAFPSVAEAVACAIETIQMGIPVARIELLDDRQIAACNAYSGLELPESPHLFFEFHGSPFGVEEQATAAGDIATSHKGSGFRWAASNTERAKLWKARHDAYYASLALRPGAKAWTTDVCVPISKLAECVDMAKSETDASPLLATIVGHVGDGNFHTILLVDPSDPAECAEAERVNHLIVDKALALGGTCTGEHGVGSGKIEALVQEHGQDVVDVMRALKRALDPDGILNPGKIFLSRSR